MLSEEIKEEIEMILGNYPVCEYAFMSSGDVSCSALVQSLFTEDIKKYHRTVYPSYPQDVAECEKICHSFENVLMFSTVHEVFDAYDYSACQSARREHEIICKQIQKELKRKFSRVLMLGIDCSSCENCAQPEGGCLHEDEKIYPIEGFGVQIMLNVEQNSMTYDMGSTTAVYFALLFFSE